MEQGPESSAEESEGGEYIIEAQAQLAYQAEEAEPEEIAEPVKQDISWLTKEYWSGPDGARRWVTKEYWSGPDGARRWDLLYYSGLATIGLSFLNAFLMPFFFLGETETDSSEGWVSFFYASLGLYFSGFFNSTPLVLGFVLLYTIHRDSAPPLLLKIILSLFLFWKVMFGSLLGVLALTMSLMSELEWEAEESIMNDDVVFYFRVISLISLLYALFAFLVLRLGARKRFFLYSILWVMCLLLALVKISAHFSGALSDCCGEGELYDSSHVLALIDFIDFIAFTSILMLMFYVRGNLIPWKLPATLAAPEGEIPALQKGPGWPSELNSGEMMSFTDALKTCYKKSFIMEGRASRSEYWWFQTHVLAAFIFSLVADLVGKSLLFPFFLFFLVSVPANFCVTARRWQDLGRSRWNVLLMFIPWIGAIITWIYFCKDSVKTDNKYGSKPIVFEPPRSTAYRQQTIPPVAPDNQSAAIEPPRIWSPPPGLQGDEAVLAEFFGKRRDCYNAAPKNESLLDYLHNNRERFAISSYFEIPTAPTNLLQQWALPSGLRGNVHLDTTRQYIVETIIDSSPDRNYVIIGEPGVGKTVLLFEVFDQLMARGPTGLLTTAAISDIHQRFDMRLFYDDIPENKALIQAIMERGTGGLILTSREVDWKGLPTEFQGMFDRLTVPLFSEAEMRPLCEKMLAFSGVSYNGPAVEALVSYAEGSPIYVWSMVRELLHKGRRRLSQEYIQENATQGMTNYVSLLLQRLLKEGEEFRSGGLHALVCLEFLADYMEERTANSTYFNSVATSLSKPVHKVFGDGMDRATFLRILGYLSGEGQVIRFPHDTWVDVLRGAGALNPFRAELEQIQEEFIDTKIFQRTKEDAVTKSWKTGAARYRDNPTRQKDSFLALADTLLRNFNISKLKALGVDVGFIQEVAASYSHLPLAAMLVSKLQAAQPSQVTNVINIQDSVISHSKIG